MAVGSPSGQQIPVHSDGGSGHYGKALAIVTTLFFMWGFLTSLNDILVPHLKEIFDLNYTKAALVQFAFFFTYFVFALPSGKVVEWVGYKRTMVVGLFVMAGGAFLFVPAASVPSFPLFLAALVVLAAGVTMLQVAANPYVTVLGPARTASSRLNLTQAFNSLGTTIAPKFGSVLILSGIAYTASQIQAMGPQAYKQIQASSVKLPYIGIGIALVFLAVAIAILKLPRIQTTREFRPSGDPDKPLGSIWEHRHVWLGAIGIFTYVGAEVAIGSFLVNYFSQPNTGAMSVKTAAGLVSFYWGGAMVGRFIGSAVLQRVKTGPMVGIVAIVACLLVVTSMMSTGYLAVWSILLVGLFNSIMFPSIFALGLVGMGPLTGKASGLMVMAVVGGAIIPELEAILADHIGLHHAFVLPALCYIFVAYYGFRGSRPTGEQAALVAAEA
ncbi:MAG: sugar MFS transporter [Acidobacteriaceae bacterium]